MCSLFYFRNPLDNFFFFFFASSNEILLILDFTSPLTLRPQAILGCFCGAALVSLGYSCWHSSSVAVESCFHHSLPIKSGARQLQGYAGRKYLPQVSSEDLLHMLFPFLSFFFLSVFKTLSLSTSFSIAHKCDLIKLKKTVS